MQATRLAQRGGSVIETTVVIIIFGVVLSILMPTIGLLRENALGTRCQQHLRALGVAMNVYMSDYIGGNWLPASELPGGPFWFDKLERYVGGRETGRSKENFICPRAPLNQHGFTRDTVSYGWNERYLPFRTLHSKIATPDETIIIADSLFAAGRGLYDHSDTVLPPQGQLRLAPRHREAVNVLFVGGNASAMTPSDAGSEWPRYWDTR